MTERQEEKNVQGEEQTRGGWRLYELLGLTLEDEERVVNGIVGKTLNSMEDNTGGKEYLEAILPQLKGLPIAEAITVCMFFGRQVGHVEYQAKQRRRQGKAIVVGPDGPRVVNASEVERLVKGGEE